MEGDQQAPDEVQDQPQPEGAPDQGQAPKESEYFSENFDPSSLPDELQPAYKQMQGAFTQKTQSLAEERRSAQEAAQWYAALQDPETQAEALAALGLELDQGEGEQVDDQYYDPTEELNQRLSAMEEAEMERQQEAALEGLEAHIDNEIAQKTKHLGLDAQDQEWIFDKAISLPPTPDGEPDIDRAVAEFDQMSERQWQRYVKSKRARPAPSGAPGSPKVDLGDREQRVRHMASLIDAEQGGL